jgi:hypothetical protein
MRLWEALGEKHPVTQQAQISRCFDCVNYPPPGGRSRGECTLRGEMVNGRAENRPCWRERKVGIR